MFDNDTELCNSTPRSSTESLFCNTQNCVSDVKKWTIHSKFPLNAEQNDALLFHPSKSSDPPHVLKMDKSGISVCNSARNLGVMFVNGLTMKQQVDRICQSAYFEIRRIGSIRQFLTTEATETLLSCLV